MPNVMRNARVILFNATPSMLCNHVPRPAQNLRKGPSTNAVQHVDTRYHMWEEKKKRDTSNSIQSATIQSRTQLNKTMERISPICLHHPNTPYYWHTARSIRCIGQSSAVDWVERPYRPDLDAYHRVGHQRVS
jgi:hypothetical protein